MIDTYRIKACKAFEKSVLEEKQKIQKGIKALVVRGRKVKQGTVLNLFWVGERPNYIGRQELLAGGYTELGQKVWIKAEYLKNITEIKSPNAKERKKFMISYIREHIGRNLMEVYIDYKKSN